MHTDKLIVRQQQLLARSAQLRFILAEQAQVLTRPLAVLDQARHSLGWIYRNPKWPLGALLVLLVLRPRRLLLWTGRVWWAWGIFKRVQNWVATSPLRGLLP